MRNFITIAMMLSSAAAIAQDKKDYEHYDRIVEIQGTDYVYAIAEHIGKKSGGNDFLMFINTRSGETRRVEFPPNSSINEIRHLQYDSIGVNKLMLLGRTVDLNDRGGIGFEDPLQLIILSTDGKEKTVITEDGYYVRHWYLSPKHGTITILGYYDDNANGHLDRTDKSETLVYDLKKMKLLSKT